jgi:hypothetical protein
MRHLLAEISEIHARSRLFTPVHATFPANGSSQSQSSDSREIQQKLRRLKQSQPEEKVYER